MGRTWNLHSQYVCCCPSPFVRIHSLLTMDQFCGNFGLGKYRVYGVPNFLMGVSTNFFILLRSSTSALSTPPKIRVKIEFVDYIIIDMFVSSNASTQSNLCFKQFRSLDRPAFGNPSPNCKTPSICFLPPPLNHSSSFFSVYVDYFLCQVERTSSRN